MNKSRTYLVPLLYDKIKLDLKYFHLIENTYIFDSNNQYDKCIILKNRFNYEEKDFVLYEDIIVNNELFLKAYNDKTFVYYVLKFPEEYIYEYNMFIRGKYSLFKADAKLIIINFWRKLFPSSKYDIVISKIKNVLTKDPFLRKELEQKLNVKLKETAELGSIIEINEETLDLNLI